MVIFSMLLLNRRLVTLTHHVSPPYSYGRLMCPTCKQLWGGSVSAFMGNECAKFVSEKYSRDAFWKLAALLTKHCAISYSTASSLEDIELVSNEVLAAIKEYEDDETASSRRLLLIEQATYYASYDLGRVAYNRNEPELAIECFTKALEANGALSYGDDDIEALSIQLMVVKSQGLLPGADIATSDKNILQLSRARFEKRSEKYGENSQLSLVLGYKLAEELHHQNKLIEAKELLERLHSKAYRVLGSHHKVTHDFEHLMDKISRGDV